MHVTARIRKLRCCLALAALVASGCSNAATPATPSVVPSPPRPAGAIPCNQLQTLRQLNRRIAVFQNPGTGDSVEYLVIGDAAVSNDLLLMFPGTGQILAGWPSQLITNARYSPEITKSIGYKASEDGRVSLCHNYRLLLFDYPGVGKTPYRADLTRDEIASDVDAVLQNAAATTGIDSRRVDPLGWSLGTTMAMKYAWLSPIARPARAIHNIVLVATGPGGSVQGDETHDSAKCVQTLFNESLYYRGSVESEIKDTLSELIFPFKGQTSTENGTHSGCKASVDTSGVSLTVQLECTILNNCKPYFDYARLANKTLPWVRTNGIGSKMYAEERAIASDWYLSYCAHAGANFASLDCTAYGKIQISATNGGVCKTDTSHLNHPIARDCDHIKLSGKISVIVGREDLFDQWTYGEAVVDGYRRAQGAGVARLVAYPQSAGHGVMIQHPKWTQGQIDMAIRQ